MIKDTVFTDIGWGKYAHSIIKIKDVYSPSNDYEGAYVYVDGDLKASAIAASDALEQALDAETAEWIKAKL